jgi:hypothetical protein
MGVNEFDIRNPESRYLTRGWHFANAGFLEISHLWEINPKFLKIMIVGVLHHREFFPCNTIRGPLWSSSIYTPYQP